MTGGLDKWFETLMVTSSSSQQNSDEVGPIMSEWKDLPLELLMRIVYLVDDPRMVIVASGVCTGWRDSICLAVTNLSFSWCNVNMNNLVESLAPKFTKLETLTLRQNRPQLEDKAVEAVATNCHDLKDLDLSRSIRLSDRSLFALAHGCSSLTRLNISGCSNFSDSALIYLTGYCRGLKYLNLCGCVRAVSDKTLQAIGYNCNLLQSLNLGWCDSITDKGVVSLALGCPDLIALDLCGCVLITDESVIALANSCPKLRSLGLYYCQNITDIAMYSLAKTRVRNTKPVRERELGLQNLNISQCTALTPPAVQAVCDSNPKLHTCPERHSLIISGCLSLTSVHCACSVHYRGRSLVSNHNQAF